MGGGEIDPPHQKSGIHDPVIEGQSCLDDPPGGTGVLSQVLAAVGVLGDLPPVGVRGHRPQVGPPAPVQAFPVIAHRQDDLVRHKALVHQVQGQRVRHLPHHQPGLLRPVGTGEHLAGAHTVVCGSVGLDIRHGAALPAPGVVDEELGVYTEQIVEQLLPLEGAPGNIPHSVETQRSQLLLVAPAHPPEIRQGPVVPQKTAVAHLVQLRDAYPMLIRRSMLGLDIHGHLAEVEIGADARRRDDTGLQEHVQDDLPGQLPGRQAVGIQIPRHIHHHLVDGVGVDILRGDILQIDLIDLGAPVHVASHPWRSHDVVQCQSRVFLQVRIVGGGAGKLAAWSLTLPLGVDLPHPLDHLEEAGPAGDAVGLQRGRHGKADGLVRPAPVRHHQIGGHGVQPPLHALHGGVEGLEVNGDIRFVSHYPRPLNRTFARLL